MKKLIIFISLFSFTTYANAYTKEDWRVYEGCKDRVYNKIQNDFDFEACYEMLNHKKALRKYGASSSYAYWLKRLNKTK